MRLYTFQPMFVVESLKTTGYYRAAGVRQRMLNIVENGIHDPWLYAYDWLGRTMLEQGIQSIQPVEDVCNMVWAWQAPQELPFPDTSYFYQEPHVLLTLEVPENRVLLTDYHAWHMPLNLAPMVETEQEQDAWYESVPWEDRTNPENLAYLESTWKNLFNAKICHKLVNGEDSLEEPPIIQATMFDICLRDVVKIQYLHTIQNPH